jgi:uncharacterized protein
MFDEAKIGGRQHPIFVFYSKCQVVESHKKENEVNNSHMSALRLKHAELEEKLEREESRPLPDTNLIHSLKKQKLHLKDVLTQESLPV